MLLHPLGLFLLLSLVWLQGRSCAPISYMAVKLSNSQSSLEGKTLPRSSPPVCSSRPCSGPVLWKVPWQQIQWKRGKKRATLQAEQEWVLVYQEHAQWLGFVRLLWITHGMGIERTDISQLCISFLSDSCQVI